MQIRKEAEAISKGRLWLQTLQVTEPKCFWKNWKYLETAFLVSSKCQCLLFFSRLSACFVVSLVLPVCDDPSLYTAQIMWIYPCFKLQTSPFSKIGKLFHLLQLLRPLHAHYPQMVMSMSSRNGVPAANCAQLICAHASLYLTTLPTSFTGQALKCTPGTQDRGQWQTIIWGSIL